MKCEEVKRLLTEEATDQVDEIRRHLASCESCRRLGDDLAALKALSSELKGQAKAPDFFASGVCSQVGSRRSRLVHVGLAGLAVTAVTLCFAFVPGFKEFPERQAPGSGVVATAGPAVLPAGEAADAFRPEDLRWADEYQPDSSPTVSVVVRENSSRQYILEVPATIEVRQTQADNEFYLKNVSH